MENKYLVYSIHDSSLLNVFERELLQKHLFIDPYFLYRNQQYHDEESSQLFRRLNFVRFVFAVFPFLKKLH